MENINKKCSSQKHSDIDAISYCQICKIFLCNKCLLYHSELFSAHQSINIYNNLNIKEIFTGLCDEKNHSNKLEYFCKTHNKLCCVECICKIKDDNKGHHNDCDIFKIENICEEKKNNLTNNIKYLEDLFKSVEDSIDILKKEFEKINESKEKIKLKIQKTFTKLRGALNEREDELLIIVDNKFDNLFFNEKIIKDTEKLPNKIKSFLEKGKVMEENWDNDNLTLMINNCINIENIINDLNIIKSKIKNSNSKSYNKIEFIPEENSIKAYLDDIKNFGIVSNHDLEFKWKAGPNYSLSNNDLIATKTKGGQSHCCNILGDIILPKNKINKWKIKIKKFVYSDYEWTILIGISPFNLNQNMSNPYEKAWTFLCGSSKLSINSGSQRDYIGKKERLKEGDIIEVILNTNGELSFSVNDVNYGVACKIPMDIDLSPFVNLYKEGDSIELLKE